MHHVKYFLAKILFAPILRLRGKIAQILIDHIFEIIDYFGLFTLRARAVICDDLFTILAKNFTQRRLNIAIVSGVDPIEKTLNHFFLSKGLYVSTHTASVYVNVSDFAPLYFPGDNSIRLKYPKRRKYLIFPKTCKNKPGGAN